MPVPIDHIVSSQVSFEDDSALPRDRSVNTFHFFNTVNPGGLPPSAADLDELDAAIVSFYKTAHTGSTNALQGFFSSTLSGVWTIKHYLLSQALPRSPIRVTTPAVIAPGGSAMPQEVALCLSYQAAKISGFNQRNRRGRIYFGPLAQTALGSTAARPNNNTDQLVPTLVAAGKFLVGHTWASAGWRWVVYSHKFQTQATITDGWVDNEFDTQRRRGYRPTTRTIV